MSGGGGWISCVIWVPNFVILAAVTFVTHGPLWQAGGSCFHITNSQMFGTPKVHLCVYNRCKVRILNHVGPNFDVLLTVHLSIFILVINQIDAQNLLYTSNKFISCLYMFRAPCAHRQEVRIVLYNFWYHHTSRWPSRAHVERAQDGHLQVWWYQRLYNTILTSWWWAHGARNI